MIKDTFIKRFIILNVYSFTNSASTCMKQKLIKLQEEIEKSTIIVRYSKVLLTIIDKTSRTIRQIFSNDIENLKNSSTNLS